MSERSKVTAIEIYNCQSIERARLTFDECGIINIKGFNNAGKSAIRRALDTLLFNKKPSSQTDYIRDGCDYMRVGISFDDGVTIFRDKYINGQSLYEMYKDNELLYTTKQGKELTRVREVPKPIADYLAMTVCNDWILNSRNCKEVQLLVDTKASENATAVYELLRADELAIAREKLNADKNSLNAEIVKTSNDIISYRQFLHKNCGVTEEVITKLKELDTQLDETRDKESFLKVVVDKKQQYDKIPDLPHLEKVNTEQIDDILKISECITALNTIPKIPQLTKVDTEQIDLLISIKEKADILKGLTDKQIPELQGIPEDTVQRVQMLIEISDKVKLLKEYTTKTEELDTELDKAKSELKACVEQEDSIKDKFVLCKNCGTYVEIP